MTLPAPVMTMTTPASGVTLSGTMATLSGVITQSAGREVVSATIDIGSVVPLVITNTTWSVTIALPSDVEAMRSFVVTALDATGQSTPFTFTLDLDTLAPRATVTRPDAGVAVGASAVVAGQVTDRSPVMSLTVNAGSGALAATVDGGDWSRVISFPPNLDRVMRSLSIEASDSLGNQATTMTQVLVDTQGPQLSLSSPDASVAVGSPVTLTGAAVDSTSAVSGFTVDFGTGAQSVTVASDGGWSTMATFPAGLDRVSRSVTLRGQDSLGNQGQQVAQVLVDTQGPVLSLRTPDAGVAVGTSAVLSGTATDSTGPVSSFTVDVGSGAQAVAVTSGAWSTTVTFPAGLDRVPRTVTLRGQDPLGNATQTMAQVLVDTAGPVLTLRSPDAGAAVSSPATLSGTALDSTGPVSNFTVDVGNGQQAVTVTGSGGWTTTVTFPPNLDRVSRTVTLRGQDALGNVTQTTAQVLVDTLPPTFTATWTPPTIRGAITGGLDFRDPSEIAGGPALFRRHDAPTITVQAPAADVNPASVVLSVGTSSVQAQTGTNCSLDGGFCRALSFDLSQPALPALRGDLIVGVAGADVRGNTSATDAGTLTVSRWYSAFDGGSQFNFFSLAETGELVVPNSGTSRVTVLNSLGAPRANFVAQGQPLGAVAVGQVRISGTRYLYTLELVAGGQTVGEAMPLDRPADPIVGWTGASVRTGLYGAPIIRTDPNNSAEEVASIYVIGDSFGGWKSAADWRSLVTGQVGTRIANFFQGLQNSITSVAGIGGRFIATDGVKLFGFRGSSSNFTFLEEIGTPFTLTPGSYTQVNQLAATSSTEVGGIGLATGASGLFSSVFPTAFTPSVATTADFPNYSLHKQGTAWFPVRTVATNVDRICSATLTSTAFTCLSDVNGVVYRFALGANDTLYLLVARGASRVLQVRTASTLALQWETVLPVACELSLVPTCLQGRPVIGCLDGQARILFLETDGRGIDTAAEWPMLGHDPGMTFNQSTPLGGYACP